MRYYCEYSPDKINHVTPGVSMLVDELERTGQQPMNILDLGCGNGRNSLYLAKKYKSSIVLVDYDKKMLDWADELCKMQGLENIRSICSKVEDFASNPSLLQQTGHEKFDVIILSYVMQHIEPVYYPIILDFCKNVCKGHIILDVFWNPSRLRPSELTKIGSVNWYGLTYEELVTFLAPNFSIVSDKFLKTDIAVVINMVLKEGQTSLGSVLKRNYEYYSGRLRQHRCSGSTVRGVRRIINIEELECVRLLNPLYLGEFDLVRAEMMQWIKNSKGIQPSLMAAKFLWLCRMNKIPVMFKEVSRDFSISTKKLMQIMAHTEYVPALLPTDYVDRLAKQLYVSDAIRAKAIDLIGNDIRGSSPTVRACCAMIKAANAQGIKISKREITSALDVSTVAINLSLNKEKLAVKAPMKPIT